MERISSSVNFDTEFTSLTSQILPFFSGSGLTIMDLQREFQSCAEDEELCDLADDSNAPQGVDEEEAVITEINPEPAITSDFATQQSPKQPQQKSMSLLSS